MITPCDRPDAQNRTGPYESDSRKEFVAAACYGELVQVFPGELRLAGV